MKKSNSTVRLPILEQHKTGVHIFRWDYEEVTTTNEEGVERTSYDFYEVWVENGNADRTTEAAINALWGNGKEQKLTNDYLAAKENVFPKEKADGAIEAYRAFLKERQAIKDAVDAAYSGTM